ncbi:MAG: AMIN domain-containing protein, partial [Nitrospinae bacterium]|nr:AMIN domain-containing protein [Nitrospinota bacterium]
MKEHIQRSLTLLLAVALATSACATGQTGQAGRETAPTAVEAAKGAVVSDIQASVEDEVVTVTVSATGPLSYTAFELDDPSRIVLDMNGVDLSRFTSVIPLDNGLAQAIRPYYFAASNDGRIEVDLGRPATFNIDDTAANQLIVTIRPAAVAETPVAVPAPVAAEAAPAMAEAAPVEAPATMEVAEPAPMAAEAAPAEAPAPMAAADPISELIVEPAGPVDDGAYRITEVGFEQRGKMARIIIATNSDEPIFELLNRPALKRLTIDLPGATIGKEQERVISVDLDESPVKTVAAFQFRGGKKPMAKVVVNLEETQLHNLYRKDRQVILDIGDEAVLALASEAPKEEPVIVEPITGAQEDFSGAPISLDFQ